MADDPRDQEPKPPFPEQRQQPMGSESEMQPPADHGEDSYKGAGRLEGRRAVVTGADSGIGRAVALAFAREGAHVVVSYLDEEDDARETVRLVEDAGRRAVAIGGDIGDERHCQAIVQRTLDELGGLDVLVNNAAYSMMRASIQEVPSEEWDRVFRTNIYSMFYLCKAALALMGPGSTIINTASVQAYQPGPPLLSYATTKGAIVTFSKALAQEAIQQGVRVNVVAPGPVWTPLIPVSTPGDQTATFGQDTPVQRPAQPAEVAPAYVFLASEESRYVVGEVLGVTGGGVILP